MPLKCRLDERNIGSLWYIADNRLVKATLNDAVRVANQTAPNDDKTKNIRHNRKEESILVLEANSIGARLNTDDAPSLIPLNVDYQINC